VVTGVSKGLGQAMVQKFCEAGHQVFGCARSATLLAQLQSTVPAATCQLTQVDVADQPAVAAWAASILQQAGPPDLLLNNAAIINPNRNLWDIADADFRRLMDINVNGTFHVIRAFLPAMIQRRKGVIVNFSSGWGRSVSRSGRTLLRLKMGH
jgi:NADP-dependent 3-hydroxy acid dehydrogenase YdfG